MPNSDHWTKSHSCRGKSHRHKKEAAISLKRAGDYTHCHLASTGAMFLGNNLKGWWQATQVDRVVEPNFHQIVNSSKQILNGSQRAMDCFLGLTAPIQWSNDDLQYDDSSIDNEDEEGQSDWTFQAEPLASPTPRPTSDDEATCATLHTVSLHGSQQASCSQFSVDGNWVAVGNKAGFVQIHNAREGRLVLKLDSLQRGLKKRSPCTSLCIRPCQPGDSSYNIFLSCHLSGHIHYWHLTSGMHLGTSSEPQNNIYATDFHPSGVKYATGGSDCKVRIYDAITRNLLQTLSEGNGTTTAGHSNRVFAVKWHPIDVHIALSGGWDNTIQIWDTRTHHSVRSIFGPRICGDSLDVNATGNLILSGSWRATDQLQEWDLGSGKLFRDIPWYQALSALCC